MSWLRKKTPLSMAKLAVAVRKSSVWPTNGPDKVHLANMLRKLDKDQDLGWWLGTGKSVIPALAGVLELDSDVLENQIRARLSPGNSKATDPSTWSFDMFPGLGALDLLQDELFPGLPRELLGWRGPAYARLWWHAVAGAGKSLVGRWLEVKHGWVNLKVERWEDALPLLQGNRRIFLELQFTPDKQVFEHELPPNLQRLVVACPSRPPAVEEDQEESGFGFRSERGSRSIPEGVVDWKLIHTAPVGVWVGELLDWVVPRLERDGGLNLTRDRDDFLSLIENSQWWSTPGDVLAFLGMVDATGVELKDDSSGIKLVRSWVRHSAARPEGDGAELVRRVVRDGGDELLLRLERGRILEEKRPNLTATQWAELVELVPSTDADLDEVYGLLKKGDFRSREKARELLKPRPASIIRFLHQVGLLRGEAGGLLSLHPVWVRSVLQLEVITQLLDAGPQEWGHVAITGELLNDLEWVLRGRIEAGNWTWLNTLLETWNDTSPEHLAAVIVVVRLLGPVLAGSNPGAWPPLEVLVQLWRCQAGRLIRRWTNYPLEPLLSGWEYSGRARNERAEWLLGALWLTRRLQEAGLPRPDCALDVWDAGTLTAEQREELARALSNCRRFGGTNYPPDEYDRQVAYSMAREIYRRWGLIEGLNHRMLDLMLPSLLVDVVRQNGPQPKWTAGQDAAWLRFGIPVLQDTCADQGIEMSAVLAVCWPVWQGSVQFWPFVSWLSEEHPEYDAKALWQAIPRNIDLEPLFDVAERKPKILEWMPGWAWDWWIQRLIEQASPTIDRTQWWHYPSWEQLQRLLRTGKWVYGYPQGLPIVWERFPEEVEALISELIRSASEEASKTTSYLIRYAPPDIQEAKLTAASTWLAEPDQFPAFADWGRGWLVELIQRRAQGWRTAFRLL